MVNKKPTPKCGLFAQGTWRARGRENPLGLTALDCSAKTLVEALYTATCGRLLLLTGVERVAVGAYVQGEVLTRGRTNLEGCTARTAGGDRVVIRVDTLFHLEPHELYAAT